MPSTLEVSRPDDLAVRIDQLVTLTGTGQSRAHEGYLANQALLEDAARRASSDLGRAAVTTMREAARQDYAAHLATVAGVRLEDHAVPADAEAMRKEAAARREIAADMRLDPNPEPPAPQPPSGYRPRGDFAKDHDMTSNNSDVVFEERGAEGAKAALEASKLRWAAQEEAQALGAREDTALTAEAIEANPWNAVYMKIDNPDLHQAAMDTADRLADDAALAWKTHGFNGDAFAGDDAAERARNLAQAIENGRNPTPPDHTPPEGGNSSKGQDMAGTNPDIVFEDGRQSVQPGGNDYSALQQQPAAVATAQEEEPQRQAVKVTAAELSQTDDAALEPMPEPFRPANTEPNATQTRALGVGIGPSGLETFEYQQPINHDAPAATPEPPRQAEPEATPAPEMATEQQQPAAERDAARIDQTATVARHDDQPTEQEVFTAQAVQRDAEATTKRQDAELPGAANIDDGRGASAEGAAAPMSTQDKYAALLASFRAEHEGDAPADRAEDSGRGHESAPAAFRSFGR